ncbi:MAG: roadblock/LC7 domain-containing protein [Planctomycetes bacterium]|nr:roadblock/LC7 domain-containing protein [Planctomycetota bacterium]
MSGTRTGQRGSKTKPPEPSRAACSQDEAAKIKRLLAPLLKDIGARAVLLVDTGGRVVARHGETKGLDLTNAAPLMAGSFAVVRRVAEHFGGDFAVMINHGKRENIQLTTVGDRMILAIVFDARASAGTVRLCAGHVARKLEGVLGKGPGRGKGALGPEFVEAVKARLEELLGPS